MRRFRVAAFWVLLFALALPADTTASPPWRQRQARLRSGMQFKVTPAIRRYATGIVLDYVVPHSDARSNIYAVLNGPDGNEWFNDIGDSFIGKLSPSGVITEYAEPRPELFEMVSAHGALWSTDRNQLYRIDVDGTIAAVPVPLPGGGFPFIVTLAVGPEGDVWFAGPLGHLHPNGTFSFPSTNLSVTKLAFGSDRKPYFFEQYADARLDDIGRLEADGSVTKFPLNGLRCDVLLASHGDVLAVGSDTTTRRGLTAVESIAPDGSSSLVHEDRFASLTAALDAVALHNTNTYVLAGRAQPLTGGFLVGTLQQFYATQGPFSNPIGDIVYGSAVGTDGTSDAFVGTRPYDGHAHLTVYRPAL